MEKENLLSVINITTLRGLMYNLTDAIADARSGLSLETFFNAYNDQLLLVWDLLAAVEREVKKRKENEVKE